MRKVGVGMWFSVRCFDGFSEFERWAREHLKEGFSLQEAAEAVATSPRHLATSL
jgi:hypothetical protein